MNMPDEVSPIEEAEQRGRRRAYLEILRVCQQDLDVRDPAVQLRKLMEEREQAISSLREICGLIGDNDWPDDLHLYDILEKHLAVHLDWSDEEVEESEDV